MELVKADIDIQNIDLKYKVMASLLFGYKLNILVVENKDNKLHIRTFDERVHNIQLEKDTFLKIGTEKNKKLFYDQLFRFGNNPIRAKIVTNISNKSIDILENI